MADNTLITLSACTAEIRDKACKDCHLHDTFAAMNDAVDQLSWEFGDGVDNLIVA